MPTPADSLKNSALSPGGLSLGLGDQLQQQVEDMNTERKTKMISSAGPQSGEGSSLMTMSLSPGVQDLLAQSAQKATLSSLTGAAALTGGRLG